MTNISGPAVLTLALAVGTLLAVALGWGVYAYLRFVRGDAAAVEGDDG